MESEYLSQDIEQLKIEIENLRKKLASKTMHYDHLCLVKEHLDLVHLTEPE